MLSYVSLINCVLIWSWFKCKWDSSYFVFRIQFQVVCSQITFGDLRFKTHKFIVVSFLCFIQASFWHLVWCVFHLVFWAWILAICKWVDFLVWRWALFKMSDSCKCQYDNAWHPFTQNSEALDENNKEHPISKVMSPKWWDQLIFCDTRLVMRISMAFSWPTGKLLLALVLQGRCSHNKNYNTNKVALSFQSGTREVVLSTCLELELVADL